LTTFAAILQTASAQLVEISDSPRLDAEILLGLVTGKTRTHFRAWPDKDLGEMEENSFQALLNQRLQGRPIAHITGKREFWSRDFIVTPDVLIPRPETELLIELALEHIPAKQSARIADLGTGSGAIAITLALELPQGSVIALDLSSDALNIAKQNATCLGASNIRFLLSDWFAALPSSDGFDLIVSNPPYIAEDDPHLALGDVRFEPLLALTSGPDGLDAIRRIVGEAFGRLKPGGWLLFEHGYDQAEAACELLQTAGFEAVASFQDLQGHGRVSGGKRSL